MRVKRDREHEHDRLKDERGFRVRWSRFPADHERRSGFWHRRKSSAVNRNSVSPLHAGVRTRAGARLETAFVASFFAWDWIAAGSSRAGRRATADSTNDER